MTVDQRSVANSRILAFFRAFSPFILIFIFCYQFYQIDNSLFSGKTIGVILLTIIITVSIFISRKYFDKKTFTSLGVGINHYTGIYIAWGFIIILLATVIAFLANWVFGWIVPNDFSQIFEGGVIISNLLTASITLILTILTGWREELLFRGYIFNNLCLSIGTPFSMIITSIMFGIFHSPIGTTPFPKSNTDYLSAIIFASLGGLLCVFAYIRTRNLWMSIGLHTGWDYLMGPIMRFSIPLAKRPDFMINLFGSHNVVIGINDLIIIGIAGFLIYLTTIEKNHHATH